MKKTYEKPAIVFEDFVMSTNIAAGCEIKIDTQNSGTCGYAYEGGGGQTMFTASVGMSVCNIPVDDDDKKNGFCYDIPIQSNNIFNS